MTLNEIEETLSTLKKRHPDLDDELLITLLEAGGWDERAIKDAVLLFHHKKESPSMSKVKVESLSKMEEENLLPPEVDSGHLLLDKNEDVDVRTKEPESLLSPGIENVKISEIKVAKKEAEPPHNLPLRPFETAPHVWEFSKYKDVFYGDVMPEPAPSLETKIEEKKEVRIKTKVESKVEAKAPEVKEIEKKEDVTLPPEKLVENVYITKTPPTKKDEHLIFIAIAMLLLILLILGYMYSNGRI
ncbi:MAG: hypothetical protein JWN37_57 [Candidatus Nomurabacteria bacterium]|nr:hypothetical protein [Candidatus Nomurabacteria bacterium]